MKTQSLRLWQVSKNIEEIQPESYTLQKNGWLETIREALGMTRSAAAKRAGVTLSAWITAEDREAE